MYVLTMTRKGDIQGTWVSTNIAKLKGQAQDLDGPVPLVWSEYWGEHGAHSAHDDERGYSIHAAVVL